MACGPPDLLLVIRPVDVNVTLERVRILRVQPAQPQDAGLHQVGGIGRVPGFARGRAALENRPQRGAGADCAATATPAPAQIKNSFVVMRCILVASAGA